MGLDRLIRTCARAQVPMLLLVNTYSIVPTHLWHLGTDLSDGRHSFQFHVCLFFAPFLFPLTHSLTLNPILDCCCCCCCVGWFDIFLFVSEGLTLIFRFSKSLEPQLRSKLGLVQKSHCQKNPSVSTYETIVRQDRTSNALLTNKIFTFRIAQL